MSPKTEQVLADYRTDRDDLRAECSRLRAELAKSAALRVELLGALEECDGGMLDRETRRRIRIVIAKAKP